MLVPRAIVRLAVIAAVNIIVAVFEFIVRFPAADAQSHTVAPVPVIVHVGVPVDPMLRTRVTPAPVLLNNAPVTLWLLASNVPDVSVNIPTLVPSRKCRSS